MKQRQYSKKRVVDSGFTLIEITVTIVIISLILGMSTIFFTGTLPSAKLNGTAREVVAMLRYGKVLAKNKGEEKKVLFEIEARRFGIEGVLWKAIPDGIQIRIEDETAGDVEKSTYEFKFHQTGGVEGGSVILSNSKRTVRIEMDPVIGSAIVKERL